MLSKEVQDLIDRSEKQTEFIKSVDAGMDAMRKQNEEMKAKIEEIASKPPTEAPAETSGGAVPVGEEPAPTVVYSLSDEDKEALLGVAKKYDEAIDALRDNIPANVETPVDPSKAPDTSSAPPADAPIPDAASHATDANAASQAQPLPGTGAPTEEAPKEPGAA